MKKTILSISILAASINVQAEEINTADVVSRTTSAMLSCADYKVTGICYWLLCTPFGCSVKTSVRVSHYLPDITVQTYRDAEEPPWKETATMMQAAQSDHDGSLISAILSTMGSGLGELGGGSGSENKAASHSNMTFTLTDSFGNPAMLAYSALSSSGYSCSSKLTPMYPYYISNLDTVAWRFGIPEMVYPQSLNPFGYLLGSNSYNWGGYYPRIGHVTNHDLFKESGLIAFRSAHFVSRTGQPHVYRTINQSKSTGFWPPGPVTTTSGKWQMISPKKEGSCSTLPRSMSIGASDGKNSYRSDDGNHVWNLWRKYECCKRRGQTYLGSTTF